VERFVIHVKLPEELDLSYREKLIKSAERVCTISNTLKHGATVEVVEE
jgi:uncharacterized OsmC-like protein